MLATVETKWRNSADISILRLAKPRRRFLVFLCTSGSSQRFCFRDSLENRAFDIATRYFAAPEPKDELLEQSEHLMSGGLSKFHGAKLFLHETKLHQIYDGVFFVDDDVDLSVAQANDFMRLASSLRFDLSQPSLTADSAISWPVTILHPSFVWRTTNFVEVMMPFMSKRALGHLLDTFDQSISSYGLDLLWPLLLRSIGGRIGIIDLISVCHRKAIDRKDGAFYSYLKELGVDPFAEREALKRRYRTKFELPRTVSGVQFADLPGFARKMLKQATPGKNSVGAQIARIIERRLPPLLDQNEIRQLFELDSPHEGGASGVLG